MRRSLFGLCLLSCLACGACDEAVSQDAPADGGVAKPETSAIEKNSDRSNEIRETHDHTLKAEAALEQLIADMNIADSHEAEEIREQWRQLRTEAEALRAETRPSITFDGTEANGQSQDLTAEDFIEYQLRILSASDAPEAKRAVEILREWQDRQGRKTTVVAEFELPATIERIEIIEVFDEDPWFTRTLRTLKRAFQIRARQ